MIVCAEHLTPRLKADIDAMLADQYEHTLAKDGIPPYRFKWSVYEYMQEQGMLLLVTTRSPDFAKSLLGFVLYVVVDTPHHEGLKFADCDSLVTARRARGNGLGREMVEYALPVLKQMSVDRVIHRYRHVYGATPLFEKIGFKAEETVFTKRL